MATSDMYKNSYTGKDNYIYLNDSTSAAKYPGASIFADGESYVSDGSKWEQDSAANTSFFADFMLPLKQSGTAANLPNDISFNKKVTTFGGSMTNPWGVNPGWLTTTATAGTNVYVTNVTYNLKTDSLFFFATIKKTAPAAVQYIMGSGDGSVTNNGILLVTRSTGNKLSIRVGTGNKAYGSTEIADSQLDYVDGTEHQVLCAYDATNATLRLYRDGILDTVYTDISVTQDSYNHLSRFAIGSAGVGDPVPLQTYGVGMFIFAGKPLPKNIDDIARIINQRRVTGYGSHDPAFFLTKTGYSNVYSVENISIPDSFAGVHFFAYPTHPYGGAAAPAPSYGYNRTRLHVSGCEWYEIETSDNVFNWTRTDELVNFFHSQGKELEFQVYGTPAFHAIGPWANIPDNNAGRPGAGTTPNVEKYRRFITNLVTRYNSGPVKKIASISPWNEPKTDNPVIRVQYANSSRTGSFAVGNTVTGVTSGITGTITAVGIVDGSNSYIRVKLNGMVPFTNGEVIRKDASNFATINYLKSNYYFTGTSAQLAELSRVCYQAAKAVDPNIVVTSPDFTIELSDQNFIQLWGQADSGDGTVGATYADRLNFHFYNFSGSQVTNRLGYFYSVVDRVAFLKSTISGLGKEWDIYGSECGYTPGWAFIDTITDPLSRAEIIKETSTMLAATGVKSCVWFQHDSQYDGNPSITPAISSAMDWVSKNVNGATLDVNLTLTGSVEVG